jgi:NAD(P)-dependent dehydrogenase (short-subunit alcohol dehydrogenase family)
MATVAITGAGRGIALELVRQHLDAGDEVIALVRNPASADELNDLVASSGGKLAVQQMDVGDDASVKAGAAASGAGAVDILYNVAGIAGPAGADLESANWDEWADTFNIMVQGPLRVMQAFLPRLGAGSKVINITSQLASSTWPYGGYYAYSAAKAGLNRMMRSVAIDVKDRGIIIGLIHPGWVQTALGGPGAEITAQESASGIKAVAEGWTIAESGDFKKWNGETHPW